MLPLMLSKLHKDLPEGDTNDIKSLIWASVSEFPSPIFTTILVEMNYFGRKYTLAYTYGIAAISSFLAMLDTAPGFLVWASVAKFAMNMAFTLCYSFTSEVYATKYRATGIGMASCFGRIGSIIMPFISIRLLNYGVFYPFMAFGILCGVSFLGCMILPYDTMGRELDQIHCTKKKDIIY